MPEFEAKGIIFKDGQLMSILFLSQSICLSTISGYTEFQPSDPSMSTKFEERDVRWSVRRHDVSFFTVCYPYPLCLVFPRPPPLSERSESWHALTQPHASKCSTINMLAPHQNPKNVVAENDRFEGFSF